MTNLVEVESLLLRRGKQSISHDLLARVVRQLQVVDTGVDGRVGAVAGVNLPHDGQTRMQVGQAA